MSAEYAISHQEMDSLDTTSPSEYLAIAKRRKRPMLVAASLVFLLAVLAASFWPPTYRSSATILIEEQEIPQDMVRSTITSFANQQIQVITQRVMTVKNIMDMVKKFELYSRDEMARRPRMEIAEEFRDAVKLDVISAEVVDPRSGRPSQATIAFGLSFEGDDPRKAQQLTNELVSLYLNENLRTRTEKTESTEAFFARRVGGPQ